MSPLTFFAITGLVLTALPWIGGGGVVLALVLHFWLGFSVFWVVPPALLFSAWAWLVLFAR